MASLSMAFGAATLAAGAGAVAGAGAGGGRSRRVDVVARRATSQQGAGRSSAEEKGLLDFILGSLQKEDQLLETDPVLNKGEEKTSNGGTTSRKSSSTTSVSVPAKKPGGGGFGGLFSRN